jgi:hypothetical protein
MQEHPNRKIFWMTLSIWITAKFSASNVMDLLKLADRYQIKSLRDRCETHLMNCVDIPLVNLLTCADFYGLNKLKVFFLIRCRKICGPYVLSTSFMRQKS